MYSDIACFMGLEKQNNKKNYIILIIAPIHLMLVKV